MLATVVMVIVVDMHRAVPCASWSVFRSTYNTLCNNPVSVVWRNKHARTAKRACSVLSTFLCQGIEASSNGMEQNWGEPLYSTVAFTVMMNSYDILQNLVQNTGNVWNNWLEHIKLVWACFGCYLQPETYLKTDINKHIQNPQAFEII